MFRIATNVWKDRCRGMKLPLSSEATVEWHGREALPDQLAMCHEFGQRVWRAIGELPERQQQVMHLRVVEQMDIPEIASALQIDCHLVRSNLAVARKKLRKSNSNTKSTK